jgi:hypothetical protein
MKDLNPEQLSRAASSQDGPAVIDLWAQRASIFILGALAALALATFRDYGITWDEEVQNIYGTKLLALYATLFEDRSALSFMNLYFYGGFFDLTAAFVNQFTPFDIFATRHLLGGLFAVAGYAGVWMLTRLLAGERAALLALAILATTPLLYGHGFINPKDAPFAWLTVWVCYFGARALLDGAHVRPAVVLGLGIMLGLALGTRVLAAAWAVALLGAVAVNIIMSDPSGIARWPGEMARRIRPLWWALPLALALMAVFWPWSVTATSNLETAVEEFIDFPWNSDVLWNGRMIMAHDLPWDYLPVLLLYVLPEVVLAGLIVAAGWTALKLRRQGLGLFAGRRACAVLFVAVVALAPVLACMLIRPTLYNGMRHFLFVVPLLGILAAIALTRLLETLGGRNRVWTVAVVAALALVVARQAWIAVELHPNQYVYYNALIGDLKGAQGRFELDYWGSSLAEASKPVAAAITHGAPKDVSPQDGATWKVEVCGHPLSVLYYLPPGVQTAKSRAEADFYVGLNITACRDAPLETGRVIASVERRGVVLSRAVDLRK